VKGAQFEQEGGYLFHGWAPMVIDKQKDGFNIRK
jgi:hypothetical protein